jgi:hypothetical protein
MPMVLDILIDMESLEDEVDNLVTMILSMNMEDLHGEDKVTEIGNLSNCIGMDTSDSNL